MARRNSILTISRIITRAAQLPNVLPMSIGGAGIIERQDMNPEQKKRFIEMQGLMLSSKKELMEGMISLRIYNEINARIEDYIVGY